MNQVLLPLAALVGREWVRFYRQKGRVIATLATPLLFWLFLGGGLQLAFPTAVAPSRGGFVGYFFPGVLLLSVLFTSIFSCISIIEDRNQGFLQGVLVSSVHRSIIVLGKILGATMLAGIQAGILLLLWPLADGTVTYSLGVVGTFLVTLSALTLASFPLTAMGFAFAWKLDSVQGFHSVMNLVLFPMWFLSGAFFPIESAPKWAQVVLEFNPLVHGLRLVQYSLAGHYNGGFLFSAGASLVFAVVFFFLSVSLVKKS